MLRYRADLRCAPGNGRFGRSLGPSFGGSRIERQVFVQTGRGIDDLDKLPPFCVAATPSRSASSLPARRAQLWVKLHTLANVSAGEFASQLPNPFGIPVFATVTAAGGRPAPPSLHGAP